MAQKQQQVNGILAGTFLEGLLTVDSKAYLDPGEVINEGEGESMIGVMNDLEKWCYTISCQRAAEAKSICEDCRSDDAKVLGGDQCFESHRIEEEDDLFMKMMWTSIKSRFSSINVSFGIRKGFQIVSLGDKRGSGVRNVRTIRIGIGVGSDTMESSLMRALLSASSSSRRDRGPFSDLFD